MTADRELGGLRVATLVLAPAIGALGTIQLHSVRFGRGVAPVVIALWLVLIGVLALRMAQRAHLRAQRRSPGRSDPVTARDQFDILTTSGAAMMWMSAAALVAAAATGWASLSLVGVLGLATVLLAATWTAIAAGGDAPWRRAAIARAILPELAVEGGALREELRITGVRIPVGMRLFATGAAMPHGAVTRYAVGSEASRAELRFDSEIGPALRGEHRAPPLALWLGDVLGLSRTPTVRRGATSFRVLPRPAEIRGARALLGAGGDDAIARPTLQQPSEGTFRIRDYAPGDDTRRIHWVRSLQIDGLVVRLPDELPNAEPDVRLVLDNELRGTGSLTCRAPHELLDALVRIWLGVARALCDAGCRVTLVAAVDQAGGFAALERAMIARSPGEALRLGGRIAWQAQLPLAHLVSDRPVRQLIVSSRPRELPIAAPVSWIVVPETDWTSPEPVPARPSAIRLAFPSGSIENRGAVQRRSRRRLEAMAQDRALFSQVMCWTYVQGWSGHVVARPSQGQVQLAVIP